MLYLNAKYTTFCKYCIIVFNFLQFQFFNNLKVTNNQHKNINVESKQKNQSNTKQKKAERTTRRNTRNSRL